VSARIMVVDDDPDIRTMICDALAFEGFQVAALCDGAAALDAMRTEPPSLVLLDLMLPEKSGFDVIREVRSDRSLADLCIVAMSAGYQLRDVSRQALEVDALLPKPFDLDTLYAVVAHCLQRVPTPQA
jgi:two-component system OmpR family response regulator